METDVSAKKEKKKKKKHADEWVAQKHGQNLWCNAVLSSESFE
jgi:hypothetical protein